jgi:6-phosphogluconolactonase (cycloisomerase 2 family)
MLAVAAGLALARARPSAAQQRRSVRGELFAYIGTYTPNGEGIYLCSMNPDTGALTLRKTFKEIENPSWLALAPSRQHLYALSEVNNYGGAKSGSVSAYAIDRENGDLTRLNVVSSEGSTPAHLSVHPSGKYVLVANYFGGTVAVLPIQPNGALGNVTDVHIDTGAHKPWARGRRPTWQLRAE